MKLFKPIYRTSIYLNYPSYLIYLICLFVHLSIRLSVSLCVCLSMYLLCTYLSIYCLFIKSYLWNRSNYIWSPSIKAIYLIWLPHLFASSIWSIYLLNLSTYSISLTTKSVYLPFSWIHLFVSLSVWLSIYLSSIDLSF